MTTFYSAPSSSESQTRADKEKCYPSVPDWPRSIALWLTYAGLHKLIKVPEELQVSSGDELWASLINRSDEPRTSLSDPRKSEEPRDDDVVLECTLGDPRNIRRVGRTVIPPGSVLGEFTSHDDDSPEYPNLGHAIVTVLQAIFQSTSDAHKETEGERDTVLKVEEEIDSAMNSLSNSWSVCVSEKRGLHNDQDYSKAMMLWGWLMCSWAASHTTEMSLLSDSNASLAEPLEELMRLTIGEFILDETSEKTSTSVVDVETLSDSDREDSGGVENKNSEVNLLCTSTKGRYSVIDKSSSGEGVWLRGEERRSVCRPPDDRASHCPRETRKARPSIQAFCSRLSVATGRRSASPPHEGADLPQPSRPTVNHQTHTSSRPPLPSNLKSSHLPPNHNLNNMNTRASLTNVNRRPNRLPSSDRILPSTNPALSTSSNIPRTGRRSISGSRPSVPPMNKPPVPSPISSLENAPAGKGAPVGTTLKRRNSTTTATTSTTSSVLSSNECSSTNTTKIRSGCASITSPPDTGIPQSVDAVASSTSKATRRSLSTSSCHPHLPNGRPLSGTGSSIGGGRVSTNSQFSKLRCVVEELKKENLALTLEVSVLSSTISELREADEGKVEDLERAAEERSKVQTEVETRKDIELELHCDLHLVKEKLAESEASLRREKAKRQSLEEMMQVLMGGSDLSEQAQRERIETMKSREEEMTSLRHKVEQLRKTVSDNYGLKQKYNEMKEENSELGNKVSEMTNEVMKQKKANQELSEEVKVVEQLHAKRRALEAELDAQKICGETQLQLVHTLKERNDKAEQLIAALREQQRDAQNVEENGEPRVERYSDRGGGDCELAALDPIRRQLESEVKRLTDENLKLRGESLKEGEYSHTTQRQAEELRKEIEDLRERLTKSQAIEVMTLSENAVLTTRIDECTKECENMKRSIESEKERLRGKGEQINEDLTHYRGLLEKLEHRYEILSKELSAERVVTGELRDKLSVSKRETESKESECNQVMMQLQAEKEAMRQARVDIEENWRAKLEPLHNEVRVLRCTVQSDSSSKEVELRIGREKDIEIDAVKSQLARVNVNRDTLQSKLLEAEDECSRLRQQIGIYANESETQRQCIKKVTEQRDTLEKHAQGIQAQLIEVNQELIQHKSMLDEMKESCNRERQRAMRLEGQMGELEGEVELLLGGGLQAGRQASREACIETLVRSNKDLTEEVAHLKGEVEMLKEGNHSQHEEVPAMPTGLDEELVQSRVKCLVKEREHLKHQLRQRDWGLAEVEDCFKQLQDRYESLSQTHMRLVLANRKLQAEQDCLLQQQRRVPVSGSENKAEGAHGGETENGRESAVPVESEAAGVDGGEVRRSKGVGSMSPSRQGRKTRDSRQGEISSTPGQGGDVNGGESSGGDVQPDVAVGSQGNARPTERQEGVNDCSQLETETSVPVAHHSSVGHRQLTTDSARSGVQSDTSLGGGGDEASHISADSVLHVVPVDSHKDEEGGAAENTKKNRADRDDAVVKHSTKIGDTSISSTARKGSDKVEGGAEREEKGQLGGAQHHTTQKEALATHSESDSMNGEAHNPVREGHGRGTGMPENEEMGISLVSPTRSEKNKYEEKQGPLKDRESQHGDDNEKRQRVAKEREREREEKERERVTKERESEEKERERVEKEKERVEKEKERVEKERERVEKERKREEREREEKRRSDEKPKAKESVPYEDDEDMDTEQCRQQ